jgi:MFS family permease
MSASVTLASLHKSLGESRMTRGQIIAVVLVVLIAGLDGYDGNQCRTSPVVSKAWGIDKATLGQVLACSLFGMAGGSLGLSPLADVLGRRPMVLGGILLMTIGSLLSGLSQTVQALAGSRALTGLGIGVLVPLTTAIAAEFSNLRRRGFAVAATTVGFSLGGVAGGLVSAAILNGSYLGLGVRGRSGRRYNFVCITCRGSQIGIGGREGLVKYFEA